MKRPPPWTVRWAAVVFGWAAFACSDDEPAPAACELDDDVDVEVRSVELNTGFSSEQCPEVSPDDLNAALGDAGSDPCELELRNCVLSISCELGIAQGNGELRYADGVFTGGVLVTDPIDCSYDVTAKPR